MPNRLANQTSPYLLQHAGNPVDWYPWGPEALERARREGRPIFLSIGYSACHWCHVMEHESFENPAIAGLMNEHYVCIKVDREERPDLDQIYMNAVQLMTQRGGWPMSVFLTPDLRPFYGGTYWPPHARHGMPGFDQVLLAVADAWQNRRSLVLEQAGDLTENLREIGRLPAADVELNGRLLDAAAAALGRAFDAQYGGFGRAPKFPHPIDLRLLVRLGASGNPRALQMATLTLDRMAAGGMYDQLGGGFHRYSVDERWLVPHFEKMLYDNALLTGAYVDAYLATGHERFARIARQTCDYVLAEMTDPAGAFYSTQDADSEGEEGKFFLWSPDEIAAVLGAERAGTFCEVFDVTERGNFEGRNILNLPRPIEEVARELQRDPAELTRELDAARAELYQARSKRVAPARDEKVLVAWNGLMIEALAEAATALDEPRYLKAATRAADFLLANLRRPDGRLLHCWCQGKATLDAYLDDYAALAAALVALYQAGFEERYVAAAVELTEQMLAHFADREAGGFFYTAGDHEQLIARPKELMDNATPSGNALAATVLVRLALLTGRDDFRSAAEETFRAASAVMLRTSMAAGQLLRALDLQLGPSAQFVIVGEPQAAETRALLAELHRRYLPNKVVALRQPARRAKRRSTRSSPASYRTAASPPSTCARIFPARRRWWVLNRLAKRSMGWPTTGGSGGVVNASHRSAAGSESARLRPAARPVRRRSRRLRGPDRPAGRHCRPGRPGPRPPVGRRPVVPPDRAPAARHRPGRANRGSAWRAEFRCRQCGPAADRRPGPSCAARVRSARPGGLPLRADGSPLGRRRSDAERSRSCCPTGRPGRGPAHASRLPSEPLPRRVQMMAGRPVRPMRGVLDRRQPASRAAALRLAQQDEGHEQGPHQKQDRRIVHRRDPSLRCPRGGALHKENGSSAVNPLLETGPTYRGGKPHGSLA